MNQAQRILEILSLLHTKESICTQRLCELFELDERTIQRDLKILKKFLDEKLFSPKRGCYTLQNRNDLFSALSKNDDTKAFFEFITLFDDKQLAIFDQDEFPIIKHIRRETKEIYHLLEKPIESLETPFLSTIKEAISNRRYANLTLRETKERDLNEIKPLKIVFAEGNWYLAAMTKNYKENDGFKFFRINFITSFTLLPQTYHDDIQAQTFIQEFQSLFQHYNTPTKEVRLEVDAEVARYFLVKKHLKSQDIIETKPNGNLIMIYRFNNPMEIIPLIKKWLPHIRVISPKEIDMQIREEIQTYLNR